MDVNKEKLQFELNRFHKLINIFAKIYKQSVRSLLDENQSDPNTRNVALMWLGNMWLVAISAQLKDDFGDKIAKCMGLTDYADLVSKNQLFHDIKEIRNIIIHHKAQLMGHTNSKEQNKVDGKIKRITKLAHMVKDEHVFIQPKDVDFIIKELLAWIETISREQ